MGTKTVPSFYHKPAWVVAAMGLALGLGGNIAWGQVAAPQPHVIIHRQALQAAPENSWAALKQAVLWGADQTVTLEIDLVATKDGKIFLCHDPWLDGKNDEVPGPTTAWLWEEINDVDVGSWYDRRFKDERLPLFEDVLEFCKLNNVRLTLDPRDSVTKAMIQAVLKKHDADSVVYWGWRDGFGRLVGGQRKIATFDADREPIRQQIKQWLGDTIWVDDPRVLLDVLHRDVSKREVKMPPLRLDYRVEDLDFDVLVKQVGAGGDQGRIAAARLRKHFKERAAGTFVAMLRQPGTPPEVKTTALRALGRLGNVVRGTDKAAEALRLALADSAAEVRAAAAYALGKLKDEDAVAGLAELLGKRPGAAKVRVEAARALGRLGSARALQPLLETAKEEREKLVREGFAFGKGRDLDSLYWMLPQVLWACYRALGDLGGEQAREFLLAQYEVKQMQGKDALLETIFVRQAALTAAANIGGVKALAAAKAEAWNPPFDTYMNFVTLTRNFAPKEVVPVLLEFLGHLKVFQRQEAFYALLRIGEPAVEPLVGLLKNQQTTPLAREWATWTLGWMDDPRAVAPLTSALQDKVPEVRAKAAWAMGRMRVKDSSQRLQELAKDPDAMVRAYALEAWERLAAPTVPIAPKSSAAPDSLKPLTFKGWYHNEDYYRLGWGDLDVVNGKAYLNSNGERLVVVDVADASNPKEVGVFSFPRGAAFHDIKVRDNNAYTVEYFGNRFRTLDVSNPAKIKEKASLPLNGGFHLQLQGSYAYVVSQAENKLTIIDISQPESPRMHGWVSDSVKLKSACYLRVAGNYAYVNFWKDQKANKPGGLTVVDIANPSSPAIKGSVYYGTTAANSDYPRGLVVSGRYVYAGIGCDSTAKPPRGRFVVVDVADVNKPTIVDTFTDKDAERVQYLEQQGPYLFVTNGQSNKLLVFRVTDPAKLVLHSSYKQLHRVWNPHGCKVVGRYLYVHLGWDDRDASVGRGLTILEMER